MKRQSKSGSKSASKRGATKKKGAVSARKAITRTAHKAAKKVLTRKHVAAPVAVKPVALKPVAKPIAAKPTPAATPKASTAARARAAARPAARRAPHVTRVATSAAAQHRHVIRMARMSTFAYMNAPLIAEAFDVGDTVEVFCDHERNGERVRGWIKGIVVQVDNKLVAVQFRSNVFLTDGWMVPDRILWYSLTSDQIRPATFAKKGSHKVIPDY